MRTKTNNFTFFVEQVLVKVPLDLIVRALVLKVLVQVTLVFANDIDLCEEGELDCKLLGDPVLDLLLFPRFLRAKLVTGAG